MEATVAVASRKHGKSSMSVPAIIVGLMSSRRSAANVVPAVSALSRRLLRRGSCATTSTHYCVS
jgi:hypothetical protein